jgi:protein-S-isoprenylcysteine O-methyltransferase Ste14
LPGVSVLSTHFALYQDETPERKFKMTAKVKKLFLFVGILTGMITACLGLETQRSNHLGWALLFSGTAFSTIEAITLGIFILQDTGERQMRDRSLWLPVIGVLVMSLVTPLEYLYMTPVLERSDHAQDIGLILFVGGICFYLLLLNSPGSTNIPRKPAGKPPRQLCVGIMQWAYRPIFACLLLFALGLSIGYASLIGFLLLFILVLPGLVYRMKLEDRELRMIE